MEVTFTNPIYLWSLLIVPVLVILYFVSIKYSRALTLKFANFVALSRISKGVRETPNIIILIVRMLALILIILSISGMTIWYVGETSYKDYVLAIDASSSMLTDDFVPTRLDAAKIAAANFVEKLPINADVGIISFAGVSFVEQPLTIDKVSAKQAITNLTAKAIGGTDFGNAIITATNLLIPSKKAKVIILLTDGRSNIGIAENRAILYALEEHIIIHTIGIGSEKTTDNKFELGVDEEALKNIANYTQGKYYYVQNANNLNDVYDEIVTEKSIGNNPIELSFIFLLIALFLLLNDWLLGNTIYRRLP